MNMLNFGCNGASLNRKLFKMHFHMTPEDEMNSGVDKTHETVNLFSPEKRFIYFVSDVYHLLKTARIFCQILAMVNSRDT